MYIVNSCSYRLVTGRNEVLAKVIFSQASVCPQGGGYPSMPCKSVPRGWGLVPGGSGPRGGVWSRGVSNFFLGGGAVKGGPPNFLGGNFFLISAFFGDTPPPLGPDTGIRSTFGRYASYWNAFLYCIALHSPGEAGEGHFITRSNKIKLHNLMQIARPRQAFLFVV